MRSARASGNTFPGRVRSRRSGVIAVLAATATVVTSAAFVSAAPAGAAQPARATLRGSAPAWTHTGATGTVAAKSPVNIRVYLAPKTGLPALERAAAAVSTPGNPSYGRYLTSAQYRARYAPSASQLASVRSWLSSTGFRVTGVDGSGRYLTASGDVSAARRAFGVSIKTYRYQGATVKGPSGDASVPVSVAGLVSGVDGLDNLRHTLAPRTAGAQAVAPPPTGFNNARPCSLYYGQLLATKQADFTTALPKYQGAHRNYAVCGYQPAQLRGAYGVTKTPYTGKGISVGIIDAYASPTIRKDANKYATLHGDPAFGATQLTQSVPATFTHVEECDASGWYGEQTLDVEAVHAIATKAKVRYYGAKSCYDQDLLDTLNRALDENTVSVISNSYGEADYAISTGSAAAFHQSALQAGLQGVSLLFSSGDSGDEVATTGLRQTDSPASDPAVTAVGGTATAIGPDNTILWQTGWGTRKASLAADGKTWTAAAYQYGAGGGYSSLFQRPAYQKGVVTSQLQGRAVPDIAANADPTTGMLVGQTQTFATGVQYGEYRIGGTSLASPLTAGMVALALERKGARLGFLNPALYRAARSTSFTDVLPVHTGDGNVRPDFVNGVDAADGLLYSIRTFDQDASLTVTKGWDDVTGLGTPNVNFIRNFAR